MSHGMLECPFCSLKLETPRAFSRHLQTCEAEAYARDLERERQQRESRLRCDDWLIEGPREVDPGS